ncbi:MAG TPA: AMP-binding protein [Kofleriaceae bacterium]|nr:AMP-binding protein [Kofleriaceae bacterium]
MSAREASSVISADEQERGSSAISADAQERGSSAIRLILSAAARHGGRAAIEEPDGTVVTYAALLARAREAAAAVAPGEIVELAAERSAAFVAGCLGAWLAGAAWVPIDPAEPAARRDAIRARVRAAAAAHRGGGGGGGGELAYLIATSGSTGAPKLVMVGHGGLPALLRAQIDAFALEPGARALWLHAPVFDASISDWGTALAAGATLVIPSREVLATPAALRGELERRRITHVDLPPALLAHLPPERPPPELRVVVLGGEACSVEPLRELARRLRAVVVYGPTEATVCSSLVVVDPERWTRPSIGAPLPGVVYRVIDGELWIGGACLALGYADDPEETARRFVEQDGVRMYRTGDRVEAHGGALAFVGRVDRQTKLGGRRVELAEIEAVLRRAPGVRDAAALVRPVVPGGRARLVAFVELAAGEGEDAAIAAARAFLREAAPPWMVPARMVAGPLPRTATGKIDHAALVRRELPARPAAGGGPLAAELAALWRDALGVDAEDGTRFRDAGGDSLAALVLQAAAAARGIALDAAALAGDPTFAELVERARAAPPPAALTVAECEQRGLAARRPAARVHRAGGAGGAGGCVLVTGATGTLGRALIRQWQARDPRPLLALVRAPDDAAARRRLGEDAGGIEVLRGDVARPELGLSPEAWRALAGRVAAVVHAAAHVELSAGWDAHAAGNVDGTAEIARLVETGGDVAWHHVSTLSVFAGTDRQAGRHAEDAAPAAAARARGGYAQTKLAAEAIARAARGRAAPTTITRLGLLVSEAPRAGEQLAMTLRGLARLGAVPAGGAELRVDLTPLPYAAAAVAALALRAEAALADAVHHVAGVGSASLPALVAALRDAGATLAELSPDAWAERARVRLADPDIAMAYVSLGRVHAAPADRARLAPFDLFLATGADFDTERTARLLAELGVPAPPADRAFLARLAAGALRAEPAR